MRNALTLKFISTTIVALLLSACESKSEAPAAAERNAAAQTAAAETHTHAPRGAKPGSHADWCGEHQVPESQCTRCNPSLIPAFKATGDWCEEHGLPESQCFQCNPSLNIERPPKTSEANP